MIVRLSGADLAGAEQRTAHTNRRIDRPGRVLAQLAHGERGDITTVRRASMSGEEIGLVAELGRRQARLHVAGC